MLKVLGAIAFQARKLRAQCANWNPSRCICCFSARRGVERNPASDFTQTLVQTWIGDPLEAIKASRSVESLRAQQRN